jgi:hypothetical protein
MSFLRRISFSSVKNEAKAKELENLFRLENQDIDRVEELNKNFIMRDADRFAPQMVK